MLTLTVAFPTYNRSAAIASRLSEYFAVEVPEGVELLISDNCSSDDTFANLSQMVSQTISKNPVRLVRNEQNLGYHGNFAAIIRKSSTDYVLVMSDEDRLDYKKLPDLIKFLNDRHPALASPQAIIDGRMFRGKTVTCLIDEHELRASVNYVAGIILHRTRSMRFLPEVEELFSSSAMATLYPQALLADMLFCSYECWYYGENLVTKAEHLNTHIVDNITSKGGRYYYLASRWEQLKGELAFLQRLQSSDSFDFDKAKIDLLVQAVQAKVFYVLRFGLEKEMPDLAGPFLEGARSITKRQIDEMAGRIERLQAERDGLETALAAFVERTGALERERFGAANGHRRADPDLPLSD